MNNFRYLFETLPWLGFFSAIVLSWYYFLRARNKERLALIEKGADVSEIYKNHEVKVRFPWLKMGILISGIALGVAVGAVIAIIIESKGTNIEVEPFILISGLFFGGLSMIVAHFSDRSARK